MKHGTLTVLAVAAGLATTLGVFTARCEAQPKVSGGAGQQATQAAPPIVFEPTELDLGVGKPGEKLTSEVTLRNTGTTPLKIIRMKGSCSCTVPSIDREVIPPGETAKITVAFDPGWLPIKQRKLVNVFAEGYQRPAVLQVVGEVAFAVRTEKPVLKLSVSEPTASFWVEAVDGASFRVLRVNGKETDGKGQPVSSGEAAEKHDIAYAFGEEEIPTFLVIETDHPEGAVLVMRMDHPTVMKREAATRTSWRTERTFVNLDRMYPGETVEFVVPVSGPLATEDPVIATEDERLAVQYLGKTETSDKRGWFDIRIAVTVQDRGASGMINAPVTISSPDTPQAIHTYLVGTIRPAEPVAHD